MDDTTRLIVGVIAVVVLLIAIGVLFVRAQRKAARKKAASIKPPQSKSPTADQLSSDDRQLLATLAPAKKPVSSLVAPAKRIADIPVPPLTDEKKPALESLFKPPTAVPPTDPQSQMRILIVDDNKDTRENVSRLLAFESDMDVIGQAYNGKQGLEMAIEMRPHIVLMDINMPDMDGITATREMTTQVPYCQVIIMSVQFETDYMRAAMLAGARDYQTKPFSADELVNCIRRVYERGILLYQQYEAAMRAQQTKSEVAIIQAAPENLAAPVFMVYSPKGGCGKSAIAINLAAALQREHPGITLLDADLQLGDLPVDLNLRPTATISDLVVSSRPNPDLLPKVLMSHSSGINVLFAPQKPEMMELITGNMMIQVVRTLKSQAKAIVIDAASYLTDHNLALIEAASDVLLVINPDLPSVKNARLFLELAPNLGLRPDRIVLVINRATMPGAIPAIQIEKALKVARVFTVPEDPKLRLSLIKGVSVFQLDANAPAAVAIAELAKALWAHMFEPQPVAAEATSKA